MKSFASQLASKAQVLQEEMKDLKATDVKEVRRTLGISSTIELLFKEFIALQESPICLHLEDGNYPSFETKKIIRGILHNDTEIEIAYIYR